MKFYRLSDAIFHDCINTMYQFITCLGLKVSILRNMKPLNEYDQDKSFRHKRTFPGPVRFFSKYKTQTQTSVKNTTRGLKPYVDDNTIPLQTGVDLNLGGHITKTYLYNFDPP